ncbi:MAG TPA: hypothetical protein VF196_01280 [Casimicrobiaceae bacterium]
MSTACYRVVLTGMTLRGKTARDVAIALGPLMGLEPGFVIPLLWGRTTTVKSDLSHEAARHYVAALAAVGAEACCEAEPAPQPEASETPAGDAEGAALTPLVVAPAGTSYARRPSAAPAAAGHDLTWLWAIAGTLVIVKILGPIPGLVALLTFFGLRPHARRTGESAMWDMAWALMAAFLASIFTARIAAAL